MLFVVSKASLVSVNWEVVIHLHHLNVAAPVCQYLHLLSSFEVKRS